MARDDSIRQVRFDVIAVSGWPCGTCRPRSEPRLTGPLPGLRRFRHVRHPPARAASVASPHARHRHQLLDHGRRCPPHRRRGPRRERRRPPSRSWGWPTAPSRRRASACAAASSRPRTGSRRRGSPSTWRRPANARRASGFDLAIALAILAASGQVEPAAVGPRRRRRRAGSGRPAAADPGRHRDRRGGRQAGPGGAAGRTRERRRGRRWPRRCRCCRPTTSTRRCRSLPARPIRRRCPPPAARRAAGQPDLRDVRGQPAARRALEIAAAGRHNLLMVGPPGSGKTMLARRLPGILPAAQPRRSCSRSPASTRWRAR